MLTIHIILLTLYESSQTGKYTADTVGVQLVANHADRQSGNQLYWHKSRPYKTQ